MILDWRNGTRFRLFAQLNQGCDKPEIVHVSPLPGTIAPGPADGRMHAIDALDKIGPYAPPQWQPPYRGRIGPPAMPDRDGNFDHIPLGDRRFLAAHLYGCTRRVLDIWEAQLRRPIRWWHAATHPSLELIPLVRWDNAQSGQGFIEMGARRNDGGELQLFALNFEIVSHEVGHAIIFSTVGVPDPDRLTGQYLAFQESFSDMIALVSVLYFESFMANLLAQTHGNLYTLNMLSRMGELSQTQQIRIADNTTSLHDLQGLRFEGPAGWVDDTGLDRNAHDLAQPLTGALFDVLIEIYQDRLAAAGVIPPDSDTRGWTRQEATAAMATFEARWGAAFVRFEPVFRAALVEARDLLGRAMALVLDRLDPNDLDFERVASLFVEACVELGQGHNLDAIQENFRERGIRADLPRQPSGIAIRLRPPPSLISGLGPCLSQRVAALRRARTRPRETGDRYSRRTPSIDRLIRRDHRDAAAGD